MMKYGIDVSDNQGYINWPKVKAAGVEFAILRSTRGSGIPDKQLASNIKGCIDNKIPYAFYKYMYAITAAQAAAEAQAVIETLLSLGVKPSADITIWADVEDKTVLAQGRAMVTDIINAFMTEIRAAGFGFGLYTGKYAYENQMESDRFNVPVWIARYYNGYNEMAFGTKPNQNYAPVALGGSELWGWQYTSSGCVAGIGGNVDIDVCYVDIKFPEVEPEYYETPEFTLIDSLNKIGVDSSYSNRAKIAAANNIRDYKGTADQNLQMLELLNSGKLIKA